MYAQKKGKPGVYLRDPASGRLTRGGTWLADFINARIDAYVEPTRQGTPKGEPIGFSRVKYMATLFCLRRDNLKQIGHRFGVSHVVMRGWAIDPAFKRAVDEHRRAFADVFSKHILEALAKHDEASRAHWSLPPKDFTSTPSPTIASLVFGALDFSDYSANLQKLIGDRLSAEWKRREAHFHATAKALEKDDDDERALRAASDANRNCLVFLGMWRTILRAGDLPLPPKPDEIYRNFGDPVLVEALKQRALAMIQYLVTAKRSLSDEERKLIIGLVDDLKQMMGA